LNHPHICSIYDVGPNYLVMKRPKWLKTTPCWSRTRSSMPRNGSQ
jgi:hypothetical protein